MFFFFFFDCNVPRKNLLFLFLQTIRQPVPFSCKLITFDRKIRQEKQLWISFYTFLKIPTATPTVKFSVKF